MMSKIKTLFDLEDKLFKKEITEKEASKLMVNIFQPEIKKLIESCIMSDVLNFKESDIPKLLSVIRICQYLFNYTGLETGISDTDFDILYEMYTSLTNEDIITVDLPVGTKDTKEHTYRSLRGTLTKIYYLSDSEKRKNKTRKYLSEWISSREREIYEKTGRKINLNNEYIYVFPKWDGVSCIFEFNPDGSLAYALTRGDVNTNIAQNITKSFPNIIGDITPNGYGMKSEIMMKEQDLEYFNKKYGTSYKNTRSVVSSILNSDTLDERNDLLVIQKLRNSQIVDGDETLQTLDPFVFSQPFIRCKLGDIDKIKEFAESLRYVDGLRCDGAVIYIINEELQKILGRENNKNKYEVAYKFTEESAMTKLKDIVFQVGLFGELAPVAIVEPVKLKGNTIQRVSLGSMYRFNELKLRKGDKVKVLYDIIPYLTFDSDCKHNHDGKKIKAPEYCPSCGEPLERNNDGIPSKCINKKCTFRIKGAILNYLNKIGVDNFSYATVDVFYDKGFVKSIPDIYKLRSKYSLLIELDGFGEKSIKTILDSIDSHREIDDYQFLGALGIDNVSTETFKLLLSHMDMEELFRTAINHDTDKLTQIPGIKNKKASKILKGIDDNLEMIRELSKYITIKHPDIKEPTFSVVFTKVRDEDIEKEIEKLGGVIHGSLKRDTTYLVVPNLAISSSKMDKAKKYGTKIIPIDDIISTIKRDRG